MVLPMHNHYISSVFISGEGIELQECDRGTVWDGVEKRESFLMLPAQDAQVSCAFISHHTVYTYTGKFGDRFNCGDLEVNHQIKLSNGWPDRLSVRVVRQDHLHTTFVSLYSHKSDEKRISLQ